MRPDFTSGGCTAPALVLVVNGRLRQWAQSQCKSAVPAGLWQCRIPPGAEAPGYGHDVALRLETITHKTNGGTRNAELLS